MTTTTALTLDAAAARLRATGHVVEQQGMLWRVRPATGEPTIARTDELIELARALPEMAPEPEQAPPALGHPHFDGYAQLGNNALIKIAQIRTDGGTQARAALDPATVDEYREARAAGVQLPPVVVFYDGSAYWLADGFHRVAASLSIESIPADVRQGTRRDAVLYAASANADHGLRRTTADKERAVLVLLNDAEWGQWSDREIARRCKVSHEFVATVAKRHDLTGRASSARKTADGRVMQTAGIAASNVERAKPQTAAPPTLPTAPDGWTIWQNDGDTTIGMRHTSGMKLSGDDPHALIAEARALDRWLAALAGWRVVYDPMCPPDLNAFTAISDDRDPIAAHDLPTLALRAWRAGLYEDDYPDVPDEVIDALYLAGWDWRPDEGAWARGHETILAETPIGELRYLAGLDEAPATTPPALAPDVVQHRAVVAALNDMESRGWTVFRVSGDNYRLTIGDDQYETSGAGVVTASLLLAARAFASPDDLMAAVNDIRDEAPPTETKSTTTTTAHACECGKPGIVHANIGGISGWWCEDCKIREEAADLREQLGDQYLGPSGWNAAVGFRYHIRWIDGTEGDYTYDDALSMLHSSAMQLRKQAAQQAAQPPADPRASAATFAAKTRRTLDGAPDAVMFRKSEMAAAVAHIDALLALLSEAPPKPSDSPLAPIADRVGGVERGIAQHGHTPVLQNELRACRRALDRLVSDPSVDTAAWDALSHRIGEAQAQLIEMEQAV